MNTNANFYDRWDEYDLEMVVNVLNVINPHNYTAERIKSTVAVVIDDEEKPNVISTAGWTVTNYRTDAGTIKWRASLTPYTVQKYLEMQKGE